MARIIKEYNKNFGKYIYVIVVKGQKKSFEFTKADAEKKVKKEWDYTTGQSFNEELINMLQIGSGSKKNFFDTQDKWVEAGYLD
tara:strand:+ start:1399 stop:1650 length:252 start_codon:yes stop_codon:yes gene_type:complete